MTIFRESKLALNLVIFCIIFAMWEGVASKLSPYIFPSIIDVLKILIEGLVKGDLLLQLFQSISIVIICLLVGTIISIILAFLSIKVDFIKYILESITTIFHPLPGIAMLPIVILWFGTGISAVIAIILHAVLWPMIINLSMGFSTLPSIYRDIGKIYDLKGKSSLWLIYLPASLPYLISGLKTGWARGWRALISAEMIFGAMSSTGGIGWYLFERRVFMDTAGLYAGLLLVMVTGIIIEKALFVTLEERTINKWGMSK